MRMQIQLKHTYECHESLVQNSKLNVPIQIEESPCSLGVSVDPVL